MAEQYANGSASTLAGAIDDDDTTLDVADAAGFPASGDFRILVIGEDGSDPELMLVTAVTGDTFTVTRGIEEYNGSDTPIAHDDGVIVKHVFTVASLGAFPFEGGGGGPLLYIDSLDLHAAGDDFGTLSGDWNLVGLTGGDVSIVTADYDATVAEITFGGSGDALWRDDFDPESGDFALYLTVHGIDADSGMVGLICVDDDGDGIAFSPYNDGNSYTWTVVAYAYNATGVAVAGKPYRYGVAGVPYVLRLRRSGNNWHGGYSSDGGLTFLETSAHSMAGPFTRCGIGRLLGSGNHVAEVGRFNIVEA